jgi:hypothetical protein|tara:strand:- start:47 stop:949 length:903 start_codon:yes stop_codon:yes gene_type:complete
MSQMPGTGIGETFIPKQRQEDPMTGPFTTPGPYQGRMGDLGRMSQTGYGYQPTGAGAGSLPTVSDPDKAYEAITRGEYFDYVKNYSGFEDQLIEKARTDTSLIDAAREDVKVASGLTKGIADRNASRYGAALTPAQMQQQGATLQRANTLGGIQAVGDARINQREANTALMSDLINIGQGVNRASQSQMGSAAADATQRKNAFMQAQAQSKAQTYSTLGSLGSAAIMALAFSDPALKENVTHVGVSDEGINIYNFNYIGNKTRFQGVMANEVPWAAVSHSSGYQMVDYSKTDVEFRELSA